ncbi:MAG: diguanylate cyclase [Deltaproteobacteria bacterium]|nr:diguanylate cyclase [Deltaproteobacteria bacterium]
MATIQVVVALSDVSERQTLECGVSGEGDLALEFVEDAGELWRSCRDQSPDVAIVDAELDGVSEAGLTFCRKLKSRPSTRHISVILVCGRHEALRATDGADGRPDEVLLRPLHGPEALLRLRSILRGRGYAAEVVDARRLDALTAVFTRDHLIERLGHELTRAERYGRSLAFVLLDLDDFATINRALGALKGDQVLREVARAMVSRVRGVDLVARSGDDEFAIVLPETSLLVARSIAERLREAVGAITLAEGRQMVSSAGVSGFPHPLVSDVPSLLRAAREALVTARRSGGDCVELR